MEASRHRRDNAVVEPFFAILKDADNGNRAIGEDC